MMSIPNRYQRPMSLKESQNLLRGASSDKAMANRLVMDLTMLLVILASIAVAVTVFVIAWKVVVLFFKAIW